MTGSATLRKDAKIAIIEALNNRPHNPDTTTVNIDICNMTNWIEKSLTVNKYKVDSTLIELGFTKSLRRDATNYAVIDNSKYI